MKKAQLLITIIAISFLSSCSTESNNNNNNNDPDPPNYLVMREFVSNDVNLEYSYDENDQLTKIVDKDIPENIDSETTFSYASNNITTRSVISNSSNMSIMDNFSYDANGRLQTLESAVNNGINVVNTTQTFNYSNNVITINVTSENVIPYEIILILNSLGLVNEIIRDEYYVLITYYSNGNISEINTFDNADNLLNTVGYIYDSKPNPFYGKLESIYLPLIINAFMDADFGEYVWQGYDGYYFPFLQNNITATTINGNVVSEYEYMYDELNYPIQVTEMINGVSTFDFSIEY